MHGHLHSINLTDLPVVNGGGDSTCLQMYMCNFQSTYKHAKYVVILENAEQPCVGYFDCFLFIICICLT